MADDNERSGRRARGGLSHLTVAELRKELAMRQRKGGALLRKRAKLAEKLKALDAQIAALGVSSSGAIAGGGKRFHNDVSLPDALAAALKGKTLTVGEAMEAVQKAGYRTVSKHFRVQVNIALTKDSRFKRVERGTYTVK
jgi:hypothetical protein